MLASGSDDGSIIIWRPKDEGYEKWGFAAIIRYACIPLPFFFANFNSLDDHFFPRTTLWVADSAEVILINWTCRGHQIAPTLPLHRLIMNYVCGMSGTKVFFPYLLTFQSSTWVRASCADFAKCCRVKHLFSQPHSLCSRSVMGSNRSLCCNRK